MKGEVIHPLVVKFEFPRGNTFISYKANGSFMSHLQEQLRKRKDEEQRQEILSHSLRGSKKLQALESHATSLAGQENLAYAQDEVTTVSRVTHVTPNAVQEVKEPPRTLSKSKRLVPPTAISVKN